MKQILKNFNFVILLLGRSLSNVGSSLYSVAAMWLVYELGGSSFYTGLALFLTQMPAILQILLGPMIDRFHVKRLLVGTQMLQVVLLLIVPVAHAFGILTIAVVLTVMPVVSLCNQFLYPTQLSLLPKILKKEQLTKGNSLFAVAYQGTDALFNAIAGLLLAVVGAIAIFYINSLTFLLSAALLMLLRIPFTKMAEQQSEKPSARAMVTDYIGQLEEGITVLMHPFFRNLLGGVVFVNLAGAGMFAVLPAFSAAHGGPEYYGLFLSTAGIGVIVGAALVSVLKLDRIKVGRLYAGVIAINGVCMVVLTMIPNPWVSILLFGLAWLPAGIINVSSQVIIQSAIPSHLLGRVMAAVMGISAGIAPVGALLGGSVGAILTSDAVILISGIIMLIVAVIWTFNRTMKKIPAVKDLTPETFQLG
ncbi:MFS general substrate transporter [Geomicrobium sp. JCM 19037]|uniref:MFS transporter n=1 Tax=Geomicrobium sp. JCM 19037 TaxID=1460634 RepID=UPI00045F47C2|nr:MFS transporter [Geomicrobium sp. JCM 19037]GAK03405.1 MFS general substrate transporter [Geomicrobium sp. JCM 19037]